MNHNILELERQDYLTNLKGLKDHKKFEQLQESFKIHYTHDALSIQGTNKVKLEDVKKLLMVRAFPTTVKEI